MFLRSITLTIAMALVASVSFGQTKKAVKKAPAKQSATVPDTSAPEAKSDMPKEESAPARHAEPAKQDMGKVPPFMSVFFLRAFEDQNALTTKFNYQTAAPSIDATVTGLGTFNAYDVKASVTNFNAQYERGLTQNFALGVRLEYKSLTKEFTAKSALTSNRKETYSGLNDIFLVALGIVPMESWAFNYGVELGISPGKRTTETASNGDVTGNGYSGGMSLKPYVGFTYETNPTGKIVAKLEYNYLFDRSVDEKITSTGVTTPLTLTGAGTMLFVGGYEWNWLPCFLDVYGLYRSVADQKTSRNGGTSYIVGGDAASSAFGLGAAFSSFISQNTMLGIQYEGVSVADSTTPSNTTPAVSETKTKSALAHSITLGARFHF